MLIGPVTVLAATYAATTLVARPVVALKQFKRAKAHNVKEVVPLLVADLDELLEGLPSEHRTKVEHAISVGHTVIHGGEA